MKFYKNNFKVKIICLLLITIITSGPLMIALPEKAHADALVTEVGPENVGAWLDTAAATMLTASTVEAQFGTNTAFQIWDKTWTTIIMKLLQSLAKLAAMALIQNIVEATIKWIRSGFQGSPSYVGDPASLLTNTADQAIGEMIFRDPALRFLCSPFQLQVKIALGLQYSDFSKKINCTLSGVTNNVTNAITGASIDINGNTIRYSNNKFITSGGWDNFIQTTSQPQNNSTGASIIAKSELDARISDKQKAVTQELNWGQGAMSFKRCTDTDYSVSTGKQIGQPTNTYLGSPFTQHPATSSLTYSDGSTPADANGLALTSQIAGGGGTDAIRKTNCEVETPGAIITNQLGFQANSNQRMGEMQAALANGLDQILSALASQLLSMAISRLTQGLLSGDNNSSNTNYTNALNAQFQQAQRDYNSQISSISTTTMNNNDVSQYTNTYDQFAGQGYSDNFNTLDTSQIVSSLGASMNPTSNENTDPLYIQKQNALSRINSLENSELQFQNSLSKEKNLLTNGKNVFITTKNCNTTYNSPISMLRAFLIDANVITNIDGTININRTIASIPWNLVKIEASASSSNEKIDALNTAKSNVLGASSSQGIIDSLTPITSIQFNTDPQASTTDNIGTWLRGVGDQYTTDYCPINLKPIFSTSTAQ